MLSSCLVALSMAMSPGQCTTCGPMGGGMQFSPGTGSGSFIAGSGGFGNPYDAVSQGGGGGGDQLYPFDSPEPWLHGFFQEIPAYGGYNTFRPHNYKHVLAQMDVAGRWGISPTMAYSHQWYHRYRQRAGMHPNFGSQQGATTVPSYGNYAQAATLESNPAGAPLSNRDFDAVQTARLTPLQQAAAIQRGYTGTAIPGISTPFYQRPELDDRSPQSSHEAATKAEYQTRLEQMQQQLEEQSYQMQVMQQRMQNKSQLPQWQQPNYLQFQNQPPTAAPQAGYQELPPPNGYQQPGLLNSPQAAYQTQQFAPNPQNFAAPQFQQQPQSFNAQPGFAAPGQNYGQPAPIMMPPQTGAIMQSPNDQGWYTNPQPNMAPAQQIPGNHAVWQQPGPMQQSNLPQGIGYGAVQAAPQQFYPQGQPAFQATGYGQPMPQQYAQPAIPQTGRFYSR